MKPGREQILLDNTLGALVVMNDWFAALAERHAFPERLRFAMELCLNEAVENVVRYAYADDARHAIALTLEIGERELRATLEDDGMAFDPLHTEQKAQPSSLESATVGGLGTGLIRRFADELVYSRDGAKNRLVITSRVPDPGAP